MEFNLEFWSSIISTCLSFLLVIISFIMWKCNRKKAKNDDEKKEIDEILMTNLSVAVTNIKNTLISKSIKVSNKAIKQALKETLKGEENEESKNR